MSSAPDTAYYLLQNAFAKNLHTEEDSAYYKLLMTEAQMRNGMKLEDTTSLRNLMDYYRDRQDTLMLTYAWRLYAATYRDLGYYDETVRHYNTVIALAREGGSKRLLGDAYFDLANVYYFEGLRLRTEPPRILADSLFYLTEQTAEALKDTALWINSLLSHSIIPNGRKQYTELEKLLLSALRLSEEVGDNGHEATACMYLSIMYADLGEKEKSFAYTRRNLALRKGLISEYLYCLTLGNAYQRIGEKDSADCYLNKGKELREREERAKFSTPSQYLTKEFKNTMPIEQRLEQIQASYLFNEQLTRQQSEYIVLTLVLLLASVLVILFIRKHHALKEKAQLEKAEAEKQRLTRVHEQTKGALLQTEEQLQQEKEKLRHKEEQLTVIQQELEALSPDTRSVFEKINRIVEDCLYKDRSNLQMEEADWQQLQVHIDKQWNRAVSRLQQEFRLTDNETRLLCLNLTDLPTAHIPFLFKKAVNTIYVKNRSLCAKLGITRSGKTFKEDFKNFIDYRE